MKGFSGEIIGLVGLFVASFCAWKFLDPAVEIFYHYVKDTSFDKNIVSLICSIVIFFSVEIIFAVIGTILSYVVRVTQLSVMDHVMGMFVGLLKTCFIVILVYGIMTTFSNFLPSDWTEGSYSMKAASYVWPYFRDFMQAHGLLDFSELTGGIK